jgi:hypothetical protein
MVGKFLDVNLDPNNLYAFFQITLTQAILGGTKRLKRGWKLVAWDRP